MPAEDFANDIELTEEEQIRLLEQYENETRLKKQQEETAQSNKVPKELVGEKVLFQQSPSKNQKSPSKRRSIIVEADSSANEPEASCDVKITKADSSISLETASSSSSDGDWEKINPTEK